MVRRVALLAVLPGRRLELEERQLTQWNRLLGAYDYQRQLERGYSVTRNADGVVVRSTTGLLPGTALTTQLADGDVRSVVEATTAHDTAHDRAHDSTNDRYEGETP
jgi:exodeoxyribonuclease VII large subunit